MKTLPTKLIKSDLKALHCDDYISDGEYETFEIAKVIAIQTEPKLIVELLILLSLSEPDRKGTTFKLIENDNKITPVAWITNAEEVINEFYKEV